MSNRLADLFPSHLDVVKSRYDAALGDSGFDSVAIFAGSERMIFLDDMPYPFKVNAHFKEWVPVVSNPNSWVLYTPGRKPKLVYYQPVDYWHKPAGTPTGFWVDQFDIVLIATPEDAKKHLPSKGKVALISEPAYAEWGLADHNPKDLLAHLHFERAVKSEYEIECMRQANARGVRGHRAAERAFRGGASEYEIHLAYLGATQHSEAELPYGNIIALNENGAVLHYQYQEREKPSQIHSFLIDAGAAIHGYASDITRTYSRERDEFQALIDAVDEFQLDLCDAVKPGVDYKTIHIDAHRSVGAVLSQFGFVRELDAEAQLEKRVTSAFFPHGVGHYIGLQVHDVGGFSKDKSGTHIPKPEGHPFLRLTRVIEKDHVFTIEPGIYFIDSLLTELRASEGGKYVNWEKVDAFRKFGGIRIEDDIRVTADGHENLTRDQFAE